MYHARRFVLLFTCFFVVSGFSACGLKGLDITRFGLADAVICEDLGILPQNLTIYAARAGEDMPLMTVVRQGREDERFNERFFAPWASTFRQSKEQAFEAVAAMSPDKGFAENLRPYDKDRWQEIVDNCFMEVYGASPVRPAITVTATHLRRMPTDAPFFENPNLGGEGFPFDYMQNSILWVGTPVAVTHISRDRMWALLETNFVSGWAKVKDIAAVDRVFINAWRSHPLAVIVKDSVGLKVMDHKRDAVTGGRATVPVNVGTVLPFATVGGTIRGAKSPHMLVHVPVRGVNGKAVMATALSPLFATMKKPMRLTPGAIARVGNAMMGQPYGWGGLYAQRDCSATMRDIFTPFGLWLPRNSSSQGETGTPLDLAGLSPDEKETYIMRDGAPFFSLVSMKGHVGLYLGAYPKNGIEVPVMFHNVWGLRVKTGGGEDAPVGRAVIGKAVVTTLRPGSEHSNISSPASLLDRIARLSLLPEPFAGESPQERAVPVVPKPGVLIVPEVAP